MSSTVLKTLTMRPGYFKNSTEYSSENRWIDGDKVRFRSGRAEKIGGNVKESIQQNSNALIKNFTGRPSKSHTWLGLDYTKYFSVGTESHVEILSGGQIYDVTPYRTTVALNNAISTVNLQTTVTIVSAAHNLAVGDYIFVISQAAPVGGITLSGQYIVTTVPNSNTFTVTAATPANATVNNAGGALSIGFYIPTGSLLSAGITGYGGGSYGTPGASGGGYNMPRASAFVSGLRLWSFDNWGEDLLGSYTNGGIYQWDATSGLAVRMQIISGAPTNNLFIMVAQPSRFLVAFGTQQSVGGVFDPLTIRWADQETLTDWTITTTNTAGEYRLPLGNKIVGACQTRSEILVFTDTTVYSMRYVGGVDIFQFQILANNTSAVSQNCAVDVNGVVFWEGLDGYYMYNGVVERLPCEISQFLFDQDGEGRINVDQKAKVFCGTNKEFNEIKWYRPTYDSTEVNRYVCYNYLENLWYDGTEVRTTWVDAGVFDKPNATDPSGFLYVHEVGKDADYLPLIAYIRSGYLDLDDGQQMMFVDKFIPDFELTPNYNAELTLYFKKYPNSTLTTTKGPYPFNNTTEKISLRGRGRQASIQYTVNATGADFQVGNPRFSIQLDGGR